jgi:hypothetical protein
MNDITKLTAEVINMRTDVLYLVRLVEKLEVKINKLEQDSINPPKDPFEGMIIEKL